MRFSAWRARPSAHCWSGCSDRAMMLWSAPDRNREVRMIRAMMIAALALAATASQAQVNPEGLKWGPAPPGLPSGAQLAVLAGNPERPGPFVIRVRFPAGYSVMPHHHP